VGLISGAGSRCLGNLDSRFLVALTTGSDLLLFAKHLFVAAMVVAIAPCWGLKDEQSETLQP
jgi:hypothetical protein